MFKKTKRILSGLVALSMMALLTTGCGNTNSNEIKIGANLEMTGNTATFGQSATNGAKLAIKQVNAKGGVLGKQITLVVADNKSDTAEAANAMQKLATQDKVIASIAPIASSSVMAAAQVNESAKILGISPTASNPNVTVDPETGKVRDYLFRATFIDPFQGAVMANFAKNTLKAQKAAVYIENSSDYAKGLGKFFKETFVQNGGNIVSDEAYLAKDTDFKATLTKIKASNPDVIFVPGIIKKLV